MSKNKKSRDHEQSSGTRAFALISSVHRFAKHVLKITTRLLEELPPLLLFLSGTIFSFFILFIDYRTGEGFRLDVFYLLPLFVSARFGGRLQGYLMTLVILLCWGLTDAFFDTATGFSGFYFWRIISHLLIYLSFAEIITRLRNNLMRQAELARTDSLTGLRNLFGFEEEAQKLLYQIQNDRMLSFAVYIDCDNFKAVNDTLGHHEGSRLLREVGLIMKHFAYRNRGLAARLGGDEFLLFFTPQHIQSGRKLILELKSALGEGMKRNGWPVTFSMGVAEFVRPPATIDELLLVSDHLMYKRKDLGKDGIEFGTVE